MNRIVVEEETVFEVGKRGCVRLKRRLVEMQMQIR